MRWLDSHAKILPGSAVSLTNTTIEDSTVLSVGSGFVWSRMLYMIRFIGVRILKVLCISYTQIMKKIQPAGACQRPESVN